MADLPTNLKDDILDSSVNTRRKYNMIENPDGTVEFEDVTEYSQVGDEYGAGLINETNKQVNARVEKAVVVRDLATIGAITQPGFIPDALALKDVNDSLTAEIYDLGTITYQQALDQLLTFENVPLGQTKTFMILSSDCGYQLAKATAFNTDWISGISTPAVAVSGGGKSYVFSRFISGGASTEIRPFSGGFESATIIASTTNYNDIYYNPTYTFASDGRYLVAVALAGLSSGIDISSNTEKCIVCYKTSTLAVALIDAVANDTITTTVSGGGISMANRCICKLE